MIALAINPPTLVADLELDVGPSGQFLLAPDLGDGRRSWWYDSMRFWERCTVRSNCGLRR